MCNDDIIIYRYLPHGSRKIADCTPLNKFESNFESSLKLRMVCHDQESLNQNEFKSYSIMRPIPDCAWPVLSRITQQSLGAHDQILLLHSEKNSKDLEWFEQNGSVGVYWWSHAVIARDWFRYAKVDPCLHQRPHMQKDFLIYNRAWSGLREYRLKFTELIVNCNLQDHCLMTFNPTDNGKNWQHHEFSNNNFAPGRSDLDQHFQPTTAGSTASADYNSDDYNSTWIEVVLETVFDDTKWHLTEKTLRPIACGKPFILAATPGSLEYLRSYGFKTFSDVWDESYDTTQDPVSRLQNIVKLMESLKAMSTSEKQTMQQQVQLICDHNRKRFFSADFFGQVVDEYKTNLHKAMTHVSQHGSTNYFARLVQSRNLVNEEFMQQAIDWLKH